VFSGLRGEDEMETLAAFSFETPGSFGVVPVKSIKRPSQTNAKM
jgi:hypothetical protein